ncbi:MAG TPA: DNA methyltransferase [Planctomycetota bacterium]|jgi:DNA modification methylase|nr:MAG: putative methyltransferase [Bacteroidetes bacterium ADurb.Bin028]HNZ66225.1 DNA methyltransferase [Planctomycetota bacterium]HOD87738.1 DNA methyltransferase [Bacteroidales bacterium]
MTEYFDNIEIDYSYSFTDKTTKDTSYITHGYYTYPAKFIPQLAERLIKENSKEGDIVIDPFMGSGTTVVESIVNNRIGIGTDINEIAFLLSKVKTTPIKNSDLLTEYAKFEQDLPYKLDGSFDYFLNKAQRYIPENERIDYWFLPEQKDKLSVIFAQILEIQNKNVQDFYLIAFAQILKSCSIWLQKSIKPTRDKKKKVYDPLALFLQQSKKMIKKHYEFDKLLNKNVKENIDLYRNVSCGDSRNLNCETEKANLIVTSPPYVTSYEYADLHQLPSLWFGYLNDLPEFRQKFIGSAYKNRENIDLKSNLANEIVSKLKNKKQIEVENYFADMLETFKEMKRVLKRGGRACVVIGNTEFKGVQIKNAEVFQEQFHNIGFKTHDVIKREIPSKMLPSTRNPKTGRFGKISDKNIKLAYPTEYILITEKI